MRNKISGFTVSGLLKQFPQICDLVRLARLGEPGKMVVYVLTCLVKVFISLLLFDMHVF